MVINYFNSYNKGCLRFFRTLFPDLLNFQQESQVLPGFQWFVWNFINFYNYLFTGYQVIFGLYGKIQGFSSIPDNMT